MTIIQTHLDNVVVRLSHRLHPPTPFPRIGRMIVDLLAGAGWLARRRMESLAQWWAQRRVRAGLSMAERARQRRELAQLTDRELRDIGITRYEIEFVLRHGSPR